MEIAVPSPLTPGFNDSRKNSTKALPPTPPKASISYYRSHSAPTSRKGSGTDNNAEDEIPRTPINSEKQSSTYHNLRKDRLRTPRSALRDEAQFSNALLGPPGTRSSTSKIPDKVPPRQQMKEDAQTREGSYFAVRKQASENSIFSERKAPNYESSDDEYGSSLPASSKASRQGSWAPAEHTQSAEERAREYTSMLPEFVLEPFDSESIFLQPQMTARITDVSDGSPTPLSLVLSGNSEDRKLSSQFSDSEVESILDDSKPSLKSRAKKAFNSRKTSQERKAKAPTDVNLSQHRQANNSTTLNRGSLQSGIDEMYSTLTGIYSPGKSKMKHNSGSPKSNMSRPGTPSTVDEPLGKKVWESLKSPKNPGPKKDDSVGKKIASVLQNGALAVGLDRGKEQKAKDEE